MNMSFETRVLRTPDGDLAHDDTGGDGPLVVCLPGLGDTRASYRHLRPLLVAAGHRVVTADPRGQGTSGTTFGDHSPAALGADAVRLVHALDAGPAVLITSSYTGAAAIWAAAEAPDAFRALVLCGPFARVMPRPNPVIRLLIAAIGWSPRLWTTYWSSLFKTPPADLAEARAALTATMAEPGRMAALRAMMAADVSPCEARTAEVRTPALVVMGERDPDFPDPAAEARLIAGRLGGSVEIIEGAGHYPQAECPGRTAAAVLGFLSTVAAGA
jgi:pimeloyl-ACP methyl ester carboxylesterase